MKRVNETENRECMGSKVSARSDNRRKYMQYKRRGRNNYTDNWRTLRQMELQLRKWAVVCQG